MKSERKIETTNIREKSVENLSFTRFVVFLPGSLISLSAFKVWLFSILFRLQSTV